MLQLSLAVSLERHLRQPVFHRGGEKRPCEKLKFRKKEILQDSGKVSHKQAIEKAENEYEKYKTIQDKKYVSDFDRLLLGTENIKKK